MDLASYSITTTCWLALVSTYHINNSLRGGFQGGFYVESLHRGTLSDLESSHSPL